jgi:Ig-like domain from next to BRCA1 gene
MKKRFFRIALIAIMGAFVLGACGSSTSKATPTPTRSVEEISTSAVSTAFAQLTLEAPTITPTPSMTNTPNVTATPTLQKSTATKPAPTAATCSNMKFVSDVTIPDGTQLPVNQTFTKTWRVQNIGTCTWTTSYKLVFSYGESMSGQTVAFPSAVATGQTVDISVNLKVPNKTGKLVGVWTLEDDKGQPFGPTLTVVINVGAVTPTATGSTTLAPTETLTSAATETPTETPTSTP